MSDQELVEEGETPGMGLRTCPEAEEYERRLAAKLKTLHQELRDQAQALFAAVILASFGFLLPYWVLMA